jgi:hypothetical protein
VVVFIIDASAKCTPTICPLSILDKSPIFHFLHMDCHSKQSLMHQHWGLQNVNKWKNTLCWQLKFFQCSQHKQILFLNSLAFPLFCPSHVRVHIYCDMMAESQNNGMNRWGHC